MPGPSWASRYEAMARHGYAMVIFDIRGTGDSRGVCTDWWAEQENLDGVEASTSSPGTTGVAARWGLGSVLYSHDCSARCRRGTCPAQSDRRTWVVRMTPIPTWRLRGEPCESTRTNNTLPSCLQPGASQWKSAKKNGHASGRKERRPMFPGA